MPSKTLTYRSDLVIPKDTIYKKQILSIGRSYFDNEV